MRASISPDGRLVAAVETGGTAKVFRVSDGAVLWEVKLLGPPWPGARFLDNQRLLLPAPTGGGAGIYDAATGRQTQELGTPSSNGVPLTIGVNPAGDRFAVANDGPSINVWSVDGRGVGASRSVPLPADFNADLVLLDRLSLSADMTKMLIYDTKGAYQYDLTEAAPEARAVEFAGPGQLTHVSFTRNGAAIYSLHLDAAKNRSVVQLWDASLRLQQAITVPYLVAWLDVSPDLSHLAVNGYTSDIAEVVDVYDLSSGRRTFRFDGLTRLRTSPADFSVAQQVAFSGDSKQLLMMSLEAVVLADVTTGEQRAVYADRGSPFGAIDSSGTRILAAPALAAEYQVLDTATLRPLASGFTGRVANRPVFNPTRNLVMTDGCCCPSIPTSKLLFPLELWDATTGDDIGTTGWRLNCGFWYPNGNGFVGYGERIEFWDLDPQQWVDAACRFAGRDLTRDEWDRYGPKDTYRTTCT
jgi:WD40 repeat protein